MIDRIRQLFNGEAFKPDQLNYNAPIIDRFSARQSVVAFSFSPGRVKAVTITFDAKGEPSISKPTYWTKSEGKRSEDAATSRFLRDYAEKAKTNIAMVLVTHGWFASTLEHAFHGGDFERNRLLREEPREIVMEQTMESMLYAAVRHPTHEKSITFTFQKEPIANDVAALEDIGLKVVRVQSGCFSIFNYFAAKYHNKYSDADYLIVDEGGILLVLEGGQGDWVDVAYRSDVSAVDFEGAIPTILARRNSQSKPLAVVSTLGSEFWDTLKTMDLGCEVKNIFAENDVRNTFVPEFLALCSDYSPGAQVVKGGEEVCVATDLKPEFPSFRPQLPRKYKSVFWGGLIVSAVMLAFVGINYSNLSQADTAISKGESSVAAMDSETKVITSDIIKASANRARAERLGLWVGSAINLQPFILAALDGMPEQLSVQSFSVRLTKGQAQIDSVEIVLLGDVRRINRQIDNMTNRFQAAGMQLVSPDPVAIPGGVRFRGKFIYPPAHIINWTKK